MRFLLITISLILLNTSPIYAGAKTDSSTVNPGYKKWTRYTPALRIGIGITPKFFPEAGIALHKYHPNTPRSMSMAFYAAIEAMEFFRADRGFLLIFPKAGFEMSARILLLGVEVKYQPGFGQKDILLTPRAGISIMGIANLSYGYNISFNDRPFKGYGPNQLGLVFNLYRKPFIKH